MTARLGAAALLLLPLLHALSTGANEQRRRVVVVGKVIIDEYGDPSTTAPRVSIGGGGPQAAWGAAAALAARDCLGGEHEHAPTGGDVAKKDESRPPPQQPVTFLGAVGQDWSTGDTSSLASIVGPALDSSPVLIPGPEYATPRIRLWHDDGQNIRWYAVNESFGPAGADGLWRDRPSAGDILSALASSGEDGGEGGEGVVLHSIVEAGAEAAGGGMDSKPLRDDRLVDRVAFMGVEPIAFLDEDAGQVSVRDAKACSDLIGSMSSLDALCPDIHLAAALRDNGSEAHNFHGGIHVAIRDGPEGSVVYSRSTTSSNKGKDNDDSSPRRVPAATLATPDGKPINPTGAGNAYSAAYTALLGTGSSSLEAACIATGVGAAVCEYEQLPPWTWSVVERIRKAADEVRGRAMILD